EKRKTELFDFIEKNNFNSEKVRTQREEWIRFLTYDAGVKIFKNFFDCVFKLKEYEDVQRAFKKLEKLSPLELKVEILAGKTFPFKEYEQMKKDYSKILEKALKQKDEPLFIFESKGKVAYTKTLSEELTYKLKKWKVVAIAFNKLTTDSYRLSLRGNGVRVNDLVQKSLEGLDGYGGGHPYAAGGTIKKKDFDKFIQNLKSNFSRLQ
ncbi:MAG: DHH family phosphoesterase, partial [Nanoarchaeota archaeon]